jgi:hypothetical protein
MILLLAASSAAILYWSIHCAIVRIALPYPQSPWESEILVDAWRAIHQHPVYTLPSKDHATHMYGPLITYATAAVMRFTGFNLSIGRWFATISAALLSIALAIGLSKKRLGLIAIATAILFSQFYRARGYVAETRPDTISILFAAAAVWMFYLAHRRKNWFAEAIGIIALLIAFGFKQTAAMAAGVPIVAILLTRPQPFARHLIMAAVPLLAMIAVTLLIRVQWPEVYFYAFTVPRKFPIKFWEWPSIAANLFTYDTAFVAMLIVWLLYPRATSLATTPMTWLLATVLVTFAASSLSHAKIGGSINSDLPAFVAMSAFSIAVLNGLIINRDSFPNLKRLQPILVGLFAICIFADASVPLSSLWLTPGTQNGNVNYTKVIEYARTLPGVVLCMDDPTISLLGKGQLCRGAKCEEDAVAGGALPQYVKDDLKGESFLIRVEGSVPSPLTNRFLRGCGYRQIENKNKLFAGSVYSLWTNSKEVRQAPATTAPTTLP